MLVRAVCVRDAACRVKPEMKVECTGCDWANRRCRNQDTLMHEASGSYSGDRLLSADRSIQLKYTGSGGFQAAEDPEETTMARCDVGLGM